MRLRLLLAGTMLGAAFGLAAFVGLSRGNAAPAAQNPGSTVVPVEMTEFAINPRQIVLRQNEPITFAIVNTGAERHRFRAAGHGEEWRSEDPGPGDTVTLDAIFQEPGTYSVWCSVTGHRERGMVGTLTVVSANEPPVLSTPIDLSEWAVDPIGATTVAGQVTRFELRNVGEFPHALAIEGHGTSLTFEPVEGGQTATWDVASLTPGIYEIYCPIVVGRFNHRDLGMTGTLEVLPTAGGAPPM